MKPLYLKITSVIVGILIPFIIMEIILRAFPVHESPYRYPVNEEIKIPKWKENLDFVWSKDWNFSIVANKRTNNYGLLSDHDYFPKEKTPLMAVIGDSYVEAMQIENKQTMHGILANQVGKSGRIYAFGGSGAPLSTYLAYADYARNEFKPNAMVFIIVGNDFDESVITYKDSRGLYYFIPDASGNLQEGVIHRVDLIRKEWQWYFMNSVTARYLYHNLLITERIRDVSGQFRSFLKNKIKLTSAARSYVDQKRLMLPGENVEAFQKRLMYSKKAVDEFLRQLPQRSGLKMDKIQFVIDGNRHKLYVKEKLESVGEGYFDSMRTYLIEQAVTKGCKVVDMQPIFIENFQKNNKHFEFSNDFHWNDVGHSVVAEAIYDSTLFRSMFRNDQDPLNTESLKEKSKILRDK